MPKHPRKTGDVAEANRKISRPDSGEAKSRRLARASRVSMLPGGTGLTVASEEGHDLSETGQALERATGRERRAGTKQRSPDLKKGRPQETERS